MIQPLAETTVESYRAMAAEKPPSVPSSPQVSDLFPLTPQFIHKTLTIVTEAATQKLY